jgi:hypothetical protein
MEADLLFNLTKKLKGKIDWQQLNGEEWFHFGQGSSIKINTVQKLISNHFENSEIYFVFDRKLSGLLIEKEHFFNSKLGNENFHLWNKEFSKVIEFNRVGIMRLGNI